MMMRKTTTMRWMRSTSTNSNPGERGLFRLLVGAALVRALWKAYWKWALPARKALELRGLENILREGYLEPIKEQLWTTRLILDFKNDMSRQVYRPKPKKLTRTEKLKLKMKYKLHRLKPKLTTQGAWEDHRDAW